MGEVLGDVLPLALAVAISPVPIIAVVLMLLSPRARRTSTAFVLGWVVGIVVALGSCMGLAGLVGGGDEPRIELTWVKLILGVAFLLLGLKQYRGRPRPGAEVAMPGWVRTIDGLTAGRAVGLGFVLAAVNPKNLAMTGAAGIAIGSADLDDGGLTIAVIVFLSIAASTVALPALTYAMAADRMAGPLDDLRVWLEANSAVVMTVLLLVMGTVLVGQALRGLA